MSLLANVQPGYGATDDGATRPGSAAYQLLRQRGLLEHRYHIPQGSHPEWREPNSTPCTNAACVAAACFCPPVLGWSWYTRCVRSMEVKQGTVCKIEDGYGNFEFAGPGVHCYCDPFLTVQGNVSYADGGVVMHGNRCIVTVQQGFVGYALDKGEPVLLPPGLHEWCSPTLRFEGMIDLNDPVVQLGPYTLVTIDENYAAITQNLGKMQVLRGGAMHLLDHRNWKVEKLLSLKIQTDDLDRVTAMTSDNVLLQCLATVSWRIVDVEMVARESADTMQMNARQRRAFASELQERTTDSGVTKLRNDVMKQAEASLTSFIGSVAFSDGSSPATKLQAADQPTSAGPGASAPPLGQLNALFDKDRMKSAVLHGNELTKQYGVQIISINVISARARDDELMTSLAKGAVAAAEARQLQTAAQGRAQAVRIEAEGNAEASVILARGQRQAEVERAEGAKQAASLLQSSDVAVSLAKIEKTGDALRGAGAVVVFGQDPSALGSMLLAQPALLRQSQT